MVDLANSKGYKEVQAPVLRKIIDSGDSITPDGDMLVIVGNDVTITIDGKDLDIYRNFTLILKKGITYGFSESVALGVA